MKLQQEADDLARTAQTIPTDVAVVREGTLPKDIIEKLKRIEKAVEAAEKRTESLTLRSPGRKPSRVDLHSG